MASSVTSASTYLNPTVSTGNKRTLPRRVTMEDNREQEARNRKQVDEIRARMMDEAQQEEKENIIGSDSAPAPEHPYTPAAGMGAGVKRHSPPLSSRSVSSSRVVLPTRSAYSASTSSVSRPLIDVPVPQRGPHARQILPGPNHAGRIMKSGSVAKYAFSGGVVGFDRISEVEGSELEGERGDYPYGGGEETDTGLHFCCENVD